MESGVQAQVTSRTREGQRARRRALKGAVIAFITAGYSGKRFIFERVSPARPSLVYLLPFASAYMPIPAEACIAIS